MLHRQLAALGVGDELAFGDAHQRVVRFVVFGGGEERLVGGDKRNAARISKLDQRRLHNALGRHTVALQFDIEPVAEQALQFLAARRRERVLSARNRGVERPVGPAAQRDQPCGLAVEPGKLDMRMFLRRGLEISARAKPHQAAIALFGGGKQHDALERGRDCRVARLDVAEIEPERAADNRLDAVARQLFGEFQRTEHVVGVGERQRWLAVLLGEFGQPRDSQRALEQRIGRMDVQMHEAGIGGHGEGNSLTDGGQALIWHDSVAAQ